MSRNSMTGDALRLRLFFSHSPTAAWPSENVPSYVWSKALDGDKQWSWLLGQYGTCCE